MCKKRKITSISGLTFDKMLSTIQLLCITPLFNDLKKYYKSGSVYHEKTKD